MKKRMILTISSVFLAVTVLPIGALGQKDGGNSDSMAPAMAMEARPAVPPPGAMDGKYEKPSMEELRKRLTDLQIEVTQYSGTERAFSNIYWDNHEPGIYVDIVSGEPLFSSTDKFDSGTGWPSFTGPLEEGNIISLTDDSHGMVRTEVRSLYGDSHLGHVFNDGPKPTGLRYCINSASLRFIPVADLEKEGYGNYLYLFRKKAGLETAVFAGGCFWGVEAVFEDLKGVTDAVSGYSGGDADTANYRKVGTGMTGHAESVRVEFDPSVISYRQLLEVFFLAAHDPTELNYQGPDQGTQYRSAVFYTTEEQKKETMDYIKELDRKKVYRETIVTEVAPLKAFYPAEDYHQDFMKLNPDHPYIQYWDVPKIARLEKDFPQLLK